MLYIRQEKQTEYPQEARSAISPLTVILLILLAIAIGMIGFLLIKLNGTEKNPAETIVSTETGEPKERLSGSIAVPGYAELVFRANVTEQKNTLQNPPQNFCYFRISLFLEDGTLLWTSNLIAPGEDSEPIVLNQPLAHGTYQNAKLKYDCFSDGAGQNQLNGAEIGLTLRVY